MENSNFSTWITSLYVSQPSSVVFACKTAHFGPEFQVSMGPSTHLRFLHTKQRVLAQNYKSLWVPDLPALLCNQNGLICTRISSLYWFQPTSVVFACKTAWLASESLVSIGPSPHVWFLDAKQRLLDPNNKFLWVPDMTCHFVDAKQRV